MNLGPHADFIIAAYAVTVDDGYYCAIITVGGTAPTFLGNNVVVTPGQSSVVGAGVPALGVQNTQTDLTAPDASEFCVNILAMRAAPSVNPTSGLTVSLPTAAA